MCCVWTAARRRQRGTRSVARAALLAAVVVTVAGLLAMHALSLHGTDAEGEHGALSLPAAHVEHTHALEHPYHGAADDVGHPGGAGHPGGDGHTAMMLCAAFLLAAGALLLSGLWRRTPAWWFSRTRGWFRTGGSAPLLTYPATGPPSVWAYSVIRC